MIKMGLPSQDLPVGVAFRMSKNTGRQKDGGGSIREPDHNGYEYAVEVRYLGIVSWCYLNSLFICWTCYVAM